MNSKLAVIFTADIFMLYTIVVYARLLIGEVAESILLPIISIKKCETKPQHTHWLPV